MPSRWAIRFALHKRTAENVTKTELPITNTGRIATKFGFGWIMRTGETGETSWSKAENHQQNSTDKWGRRCGI